LGGGEISNRFTGFTIGGGGRTHSLPTCDGIVELFILLMKAAEVLPGIHVVGVCFGRFQISLLR